MRSLRDAVTVNIEDFDISPQEFETITEGSVPVDPQDRGWS